MTGGISSVVHRLTIDHGSHRDVLILRQYEHGVLALMDSDTAAYEAETGRAIDPWWDLYAVTAYSDEWRRFIPIQVAGRAPVDTAGMTSRVEDLPEATWAGSELEIKSAVSSESIRAAV